MAEFALRSIRYIEEQDTEKKKGLKPYRNGGIRPSLRPTTAPGVNFNQRPPTIAIEVKNKVTDQ